MLTSDKRRAQLKRLLDGKRCLRVLEAHSPISALLAQHARFEPTSGQSSVGYDAIWSSSLTDSTHRGLPDNEILTASNRLHNVHDTFEVCSLPMIFDGDTGGKPEHFALHVKAMERAGVSAVVIEDKRRSWTCTTGKSWPTRRRSVHCSHSLGRCSRKRCPS